MDDVFMAAGGFRVVSGGQSGADSTAPDWTIEQGQFGWLLVVIFVTIALAGPGRWSIDAHIGTRARS